MKNKIQLACGFAFILFSSCTLPAGSKDKISQKIQEWSSLSRVWMGEFLIAVQVKSSPTPVPSSSDGVPSEDSGSSAAHNAQANSEILREILQVVFNREPKDRSEFGNWVDTLNQGASLEGVYNGLTHSLDYRKLEAVNTSASTGALRVFGEELAYLEIELPVPTQFDMSLESPLPQAGYEIQVPTGLGPTPTPNLKPDFKILAEKYSQQFVGVSLFTLKRLLGDEAIRVIGIKREFREKLALWYSQWAVRIAKRNVDFGLALRNNPDEAFHYKWAVESSEDRVKWEVLNRLHRLLNEENREKQ